MKPKPKQRIYIVENVTQYHVTVVQVYKKVIRVRLEDKTLKSFNIADVICSEQPELTINSHDLVHAEDAGNGYHGNCKHCGLAFVTDLGYCSWDDTTCVDRIITDESGMPEDVRSFASWRGYTWDYKKRKYVKATFSHDVDEMSPLEIQEHLKIIMKEYSTTS